MYAYACFFLFERLFLPEWLEGRFYQANSVSRLVRPASLTPRCLPCTYAACVRAKASRSSTIQKMYVYIYIYICMYMHVYTYIVSIHTYMVSILGVVLMIAGIYSVFGYLDPYGDSSVRPHVGRIWIYTCSLF